MIASNQMRDCYVKIEKLKIETILLAQHGIKECFVKIDRIDVKGNSSMKAHPSSNVEEIPKKLTLHVGSVRSHCKWLPTKKSTQISMNAFRH